MSDDDFFKYKSTVLRTISYQIERQRFRCQQSTQSSFPSLLNVWQDYLALMYQALAGEHIHGEDQFRDLIAWLFVVALNTPLAVRECCLDGLYVQGAALCRHLLETWPIVVYNRLNPHSAALWLATGSKRAMPPKHGTVYTYLLKQPAYRHNARVVEKNYRECNNLAHPTEQMLTARATDDPAYLQLGPGFRPHQARQLLSLALVPTALIIDEFQHNLAVEQAWIDRCAEAGRDLSSGLETL